MANIRLATAEDIDTLVRLGTAMHAEGPNFRGLDFSPSKAAIVLNNLINQGQVIVACENEEVIGGFCFAVYEHLWGYDRIASDVAMYLTPEHRGGMTFVRLIKAFEEHAKMKDVQCLELGVSAGLNNERIADLFERLGYRHHGIGHRKEVHHVSG